MFARRLLQSTRVADVVVLIGAALAWLVATAAVAQATDWSVWAILPLTLLFGLLVGAVTLATARGPRPAWAVVAGRGAVAGLVGVVVGELAAVVLFSGSVDRHIDEQAVRTADSMPAVAQASADIDRTRDAQAALDDAVEQARVRRDQALVVARCEFNPSPACPQTRITGVPGQGPETRTANELLADTQRELDTAATARDRQASEVTDAERSLRFARDAVAADADRGLGARWVAMHDHTLTSAAAMVLWAATIVVFVLLSLLPLLLRLLRGETMPERSEGAEVEADAAIRIKRAEVRATIENLWAEQQLTSARFAIEAQNEIDRERHRRRVTDAIGAPVHVTAEPVEEDMYLPIEAEAEAAALTAGRENLPARIDDELDHGNVAKTAARWIRPLVPPLVARVLDTTTHPLRTARQVFEEVEEITFSFKRTHKVTVGVQENSAADQVESSRPDHKVAQIERPVLPEHARRGVVRGHDGRRELPPAR